LVPGFIESEFEKFCIDNGTFYLATSAGFGRVVRKIDKVFKGMFTKRIYSIEKLSRLQNFIECEAHRELFLTYLNFKRRSK
jgi:poly-gamma-glutamate synthesis protein (capsule biosynthesis protein)